VDGRRAGGLARGRPTLHGGPVMLRPVKATPCLKQNYDDQRDVLLGAILVGRIGGDLVCLS